MAMTLDDYRDQIKSDIKEYLTQENLLAHYVFFILLITD